MIWAFAPVQDRRAAPAIAAAIQELAATPAVEAVVVARRGGSLADLWAFCDETLCRTVAMLRVPGDQRRRPRARLDPDRRRRRRRLLDPDHAAETRRAARLPRRARRPDPRAAALRPAGRAVGSRSRHLVALARGPAGRCASRSRSTRRRGDPRLLRTRGLAERRAFQRRLASAVLSRAARRAAGAERTAGARRCRRRGGLRAHEPERTLERG